MASLRLSRRRLTRAAIFQEVLHFLGSAPVRHVVCIPWAADDVVAAIAVKEITGADLCVYIMDDQNITHGDIPDNLMREALTKSTLRLAISPEMQHAYQNKYRLKFWQLPPLVTDSLVRTELALLPAEIAVGRGVLVGNIWSQNWLDLLRQTIAGSGVEIDWFCNSSSPWLNFAKDEMSRDGLHLRPGLPEAQLAELLPSYRFALVPSGTLDENDGNLWVARLSLPSRVPFVLAAAHLPVIVLGSPMTAAARFVERLCLGGCAPYEAGEFRRVVDQLTSGETQRSIRANACRVAPILTNKHAAEWVWTAMERGAPADLKYEELLPVRDGEFLCYCDPPVPTSVYDGFHDIYRALARLKAAGFPVPDCVIDIGASTGIWSTVVNGIFPNARYVLVDPLISRYDPNAAQRLTRRYPNFELVEAAVSNQTGKISFQVSSDLYNSSFMRVNPVAEVTETVEVDVVTIDDLVRSHCIAGRCLLKVDVQYAEHLVIAGGEEFIRNHVDLVALELTLDRAHPEAKTFEEMIALMSLLGFRYFDDVGDWRTPSSGMLEQKDALFIRRSLF
jgi:FkbM family methyltransferase